MIDTDEERRLWVLNDEEIYNWYRATKTNKQTLGQFIKDNRNAINARIKRKLGECTSQPAAPRLRSHAQGENQIMNNDERRLWVLNDYGLYQDQQASGLSVAEYIKKNRAKIDAAITRVVNAPPPAKTWRDYR